MNNLKKDTIKQTLKDTRQRRESQVCRVFELKIDKSHLSSRKLNDLNNLFKEAKWLYNHTLALSQDKEFDLFKFNPLIHSVNILDHNKEPITRNLDVIGSQIKQSIHARMLDSIKALSRLKEHGHKIGKLKFKSQINSIPLKQFGITYRFNPKKKNYVKIQGIKGYYKISGTKQIPQHAEFANAVLVNKKDNFYLAITCFASKEQKVFKYKSVGIDFGIESTVTLSNGEKFKVNIPENTRTKKLRKRLSRKQGSKKKSKKSKSYLKNLKLLNNSIEKTNNRKKDIKNKIVSYITNNFETVCIQDENIKGWKDSKKHSKSVHNSVLGGIMRDLKVKSHTLKIVDRYIPTTQWCPDCFKLNKFNQSVRTYKCSCGYNMNRDIHSAQTIEKIGLGTVDLTNIPYGVYGIKNSDGEADLCFPSNGLPLLKNKSASTKSEAHDFSRG